MNKILSGMFLRCAGDRITYDKQTPQTMNYPSDRKQAGFIENDFQLTHNINKTCDIIMVSFKNGLKIVDGKTTRTTLLLCELIPYCMYSIRK